VNKFEIALHGIESTSKANKIFSFADALWIEIEVTACGSPVRESS